MDKKKRFTDYTKKIRNMLPTWMDMRKHDDSVGARFLGSIGLQLEDIEWYMNYASEQKSIGTADVFQVDTLYKAEISKNILKGSNFKLSAGAYETTEEEDLDRFLDTKSDSGAYGALYVDTRHYIDRELGFIYFKEPLAASPVYPSGSFSIIVSEESGAEVIRETIALEVHPVWNFFDEFGLTLGVTRLYGEKNLSYKERILDVFRRPSNATEDGLVNGIARELGLIKRVTWDDPSKELILVDERIVLSSVLVDGKVVPEVSTDYSGRTILAPLPYLDDQIKVEYITDLNLYELHDLDNGDLRHELYGTDGSPTTKLERYASLLQAQVPIYWGDWKWDEGFWQEEDEIAISYLPTSYDASFRGWHMNERGKATR